MRSTCAKSWLAALYSIACGNAVTMLRMVCLVTATLAKILQHSSPFPPYVQHAYGHHITAGTPPVHEVNNSAVVQLQKMCHVL